MMGNCLSANIDKAAIKSAKVSITTCRSKCVIPCSVVHDGQPLDSD